MKRGGLAIGLLLVVILGVGGAVIARRPAGSGFTPFAGDADRAPAGVRIKVQVLNGTNVRGLARRATMHLRDRGFDVVEVGNSPERADSTTVLDRSGHPDWAQRVSAAMGGGRILPRPDSSRYLDITVIVGASWRPPPQPFHP